MTARPIPATSLSLATTVLSYPHSNSICIMLANHLAAAEAKLLFISQTKKEISLVCRPGGCEKDGARSCWRADWCPNRRWVYRKSWRILYSYVHIP